MGVSLWVVDLVIRRFIPLLVQQAGADQGFGHTVWVTVGRRTAVLEVTLLFLANLARNADAGTTVSHTSREFVDVGGFMVPSETAGIVEPPFGVIGTDVITVPLPELLNGILNGSEMISKSDIKFRSFVPNKALYPVNLMTSWTLTLDHLLLSSPLC